MNRSVFFEEHNCIVLQIEQKITLYSIPFIYIHFFSNGTSYSISVSLFAQGPYLYLYTSRGMKSEVMAIIRPLVITARTPIPSRTCSQIPKKKKNIYQTIYQKHFTVYRIKMQSTTHMVLSHDKKPF